MVLTLKYGVKTVVKQINMQQQHRNKFVKGSTRSLQYDKRIFGNYSKNRKIFRHLCIYLLSRCYCSNVVNPLSNASLIFRKR